MSEKDKQNLQEKIDEKIMKSKKRNRSASNQNTSSDLKRKKKLKTDEDKSTQNNNVLPISSFINENDKAEESLNDNENSGNKKTEKANRKEKTASKKKLVNANISPKDKSAKDLSRVDYDSLFRINPLDTDTIRIDSRINLGKSKYKDDIIEKGINNLVENDPNDTLMGLIELSDSLSIAPENIANHHNIYKLMSELIKLFDRDCVVPEILIQSLICINFLLDINPSFARYLRNEGIKKLILQTQNIEYIDLAENAIKALEKISSEMPEFLLENDAFNSILFLIEFFDLNLRKYAINVCFRLSKFIKNHIVFKQYILPAIPNLTNLAKFSGNSEIEKHILDLTIGCFYNIMKSIKAYKLDQNNKNIYQQINEFGLVSNLFEVVLNIVNLIKKSNTDKDSNLTRSSGNNSSNSSSKANLNFSETLKRIFTIFEFLSLKSDEISNSLLDIEMKSSDLSYNMSVFEVINFIIDCEIGANSKQQQKHNPAVPTATATELNLSSNLNLTNISNEKNYEHLSDKNVKDNFLESANNNAKVYSNASFHQIFNNLFSFLTALYPQEAYYRGTKADLNKLDSFTEDKSNSHLAEVKSEKDIHKLCNRHINDFDWNYEVVNFTKKEEENIMEIESLKEENINEFEKVDNEEVKIKNLKVLLNQIIPKTLKNFINFSSSNSSFKLLKFLKVFIINSDKELIRKVINPILISNVFSKYIDSKDAMYIMEIYEMIETLMGSIPENFLLEFIRDGVLDNIKSLESVPKSELIIDSSYFRSNEELIREKYKCYIADAAKAKSESLILENKEIPKDLNNNNNNISIQNSKEKKPESSGSVMNKDSSEQVKVDESETNENKKAEEKEGKKEENQKTGAALKVEKESETNAATVKGVNQKQTLNLESIAAEKPPASGDLEDLSHEEHESEEFEENEDEDMEIFDAEGNEYSEDYYSDEDMEGESAEEVENSVQSGQSGIIQRQNLKMEIENDIKIEDQNIIDDRNNNQNDKIKLDSSSNVKNNLEAQENKTKIASEAELIKIGKEPNEARITVKADDENKEKNENKSEINVINFKEEKGKSQNKQKKMIEFADDSEENEEENDENEPEDEEESDAKEEYIDFSQFKSMYRNSLRPKLNSLSALHYSEPKQQMKIEDIVHYIIQKKSREFSEKFANEEYQSQLLGSLGESPIEILKKLQSISSKFETASEFEEKLIKEFFEILLTKKITFYEMDKSSIITNFAFYLDKNLALNVRLVKDDYVSNKNFDEGIIEKINIVLNCLNHEEQKIIKFLEILHFGITSMNCFKVNIQDSNNKAVMNSIAFRNAVMHEEHSNILKTNIADILSDSEFRGFHIGNYTKKLKIEFSYKPNEEVLAEYSLDPFLLDLHNYYLNTNINISNNDKSLKDSENKNTANAFKLEIDTNEVFASINKAFMRKKYNEKDIIPNKNSKEIKENLMGKFGKEKNEKQDNSIFIDKNTFKNPYVSNISNENNRNNLQNDKELKQLVKFEHSVDPDNKDFLDYFLDREEDLKQQQPIKETLDPEKYITFGDTENEFAKNEYKFASDSAENRSSKQNKKGEKEVKFLFNNEFKRVYSEIESEKAELYPEASKINAGNGKKDFKYFEDFSLPKASEMNLMRKDSQLSNATSEKMVINLANEDTENQMQVNSNENSNNILLKSLSENFNKNIKSKNSYLEDENVGIYNKQDNNEILDVEAGPGIKLTNKTAKSQSGLFDFGKYARFESLFNLRKNSNEFDVNLILNREAKKNHLDSSADKSHINDSAEREAKNQLTKKEQRYKFIFYLELDKPKSVSLGKMEIDSASNLPSEPREAEKTKVYIEENHCLKSLFKKLKQNYPSSDIKSLLAHLKVNFEIALSEPEALRKAELHPQNIFSPNQSGFLANSAAESFNYGYPKKPERKLTDINLFDNINEIIDTCNSLEKSEMTIPTEIIFKKYYLEKILRNPALYCVEKATEYFYLISVFYLAIMEFNKLFKIENNKIFKLENFENKKINSLLSKQVSDSYSISLKSTPAWCAGISLNFPFLADFGSRYLFFKTCSFDSKRNLTNLFLHNKKEQGEANLVEKMGAHNKRRKITIDRQKIMQSVQKIIDLNKDFKGYIEFEYAGETGSGTGPTLEFYSLVFNNLKENKDIWYKTTNNTLFPLPYSPNGKLKKEEISKQFLILGYVIARGIYDDRLIDIPLNPLFWDIVLEKPITIEKLSLVNSDISKVLNDLVSLSHLKKEIQTKHKTDIQASSPSEKQAPIRPEQKADIEMQIAEINENNSETNNKNLTSASLANIEEENKNTRKNSILSKEDLIADSNINEIYQIFKSAEAEKNENFDLNNLVLYNECKLEDIGITFTLPGYEIDLKEKGSEILLDAYNLEEFINLVFKTLCFEGISESVKAFKKGFNLVFPIKSLRCFHSMEISELICGANPDPWNEQVLFDAIVPNYGYEKNSAIFKNLIKFMLELDELDRKKFLLFVTGSTRLPLGGIKNLNPKLTIVKKQPDNARDNPDQYLPTVMTCQNYLKIPEYSSYDILKSKLFTAMLEGVNSFYLS